MELFELFTLMVYLYVSRSMLYVNIPVIYWQLACVWYSVKEKLFTFSSVRALHAWAAVALCSVDAEIVHKVV